MSFASPDPTATAELANPIALHADRPYPSLVWGVFGVITYEIRRSLTPLRVLLWLAMALFPVFLVAVVTLMIRQGRASGEDINIGYTFLLFVLLPEVVTVLGMLLWATPIVNAELESQSWVYSVIRPAARRSMLIGKYFVAVLWTASCACTAATIAIPLTGMENSLRAWFITCSLSLLSAMAHGALFLFIGTLLQRRAMVFAFAYAVVVEAVLGWVPAVINKFTIAYRLRSIMFEWMDIRLNEVFETQQFVSEQTPIATHVGILMVGIIGLLSIAYWRIQSSQFSWQSEV